VTLGASLSVPTPATIASSPYLRLGVTYTPQPDYDRLWGSSFSQGLGSTARVEAVTMTSAYAGGGPVTLDVPDVSGAAGWNDAWALLPGVSTNWSVFGYGWPGPSAPAPPVANGSTFKLAEQNGTITP